jgi:hypothetical protein
MTVSVSPAPNGAYKVDVSARRLADESRWAVVIIAETSSDGSEQQFRRRADAGGWTLRTMVTGLANDEPPTFFVLANQRHSQHWCAIIDAPRNPAFGASLCSNKFRVTVLSARELEDGSWALLFFVEVRPETRWHLRLTATGTNEEVVTEFDDRASQRGTLQARVVVDGVANPRFRMRAVSAAGTRCDIGLNPADASPGAQSGWPSPPSAANSTFRDLLDAVEAR